MARRRTPRRIAVVTGSRADYGLLRPIMRAIDGRAALQLATVVSGMHLTSRARSTELIEADGFTISARVEMIQASDSGAGMARSIGVGTLGFAQAFEALRPDAVVLLGDRVEPFAAASACLMMHVPVFHVHGGERTLGAVDDALRHAISRMASYHLVSCEQHAERLRRQGEPADRVHVVGAPALDSIRTVRVPGRAELSRRLGLAAGPFLLLAYHPETLAPDRGVAAFVELLAAVDATGLPVLATHPNTDAGGEALLAALERFAQSRPHVTVAANLGTELFYTAMTHAQAMVGNSSSGLLEAPSFGLPVVNVGDRQAGRHRGTNVLDVPPRRAAIAAALRRALDDRAWRAELSRTPNPFGDGRTAARTVRLLERCPLGVAAVRKDSTY